MKYTMYMYDIALPPAPSLSPRKENFHYIHVLAETYLYFLDSTHIHTHSHIHTYIRTYTQKYIHRRPHPSLTAVEVSC